MIKKSPHRIWTGALLFLVLSLFPQHKTDARPLKQEKVPTQQQEAPAVDDLISAVNNLRVSNGLNVLAAHSVLMQTAQLQADALAASDGAVGHSRPNGISFTEQLLMLGYPLSGDLSLGGYRSENYAGGIDLSVEGVIEMWLGDDPHTNTMLSEFRSDIGAGIAVGNDGTIYYVIDTALRTRNGKPQPVATLYFPTGGTDGGTIDPLASQFIVPVVVSTAWPNGDVYHKAQYGQTLWSIAVQYGTTMEYIRRYNSLDENSTVYEGQLLLVQRNATQPPPTPTVTRTPPPTRTRSVPAPTKTGDQSTASISTTLPTAGAAQTDGQDKIIVASVVISLIILSAVIGLSGRKQ
jgi:uncharacterized protein YkwD